VLAETSLRPILERIDFSAMTGIDILKPHEFLEWLC
jgi:hypothetical protein